MHIDKITLHPDKYPDRAYYPFNLDIFNITESIEFNAPVTIFAGENGTGKSTLLEAITRKCEIHIWDGLRQARYDKNPYEQSLYKYMDVHWTDGKVPGAFFASEIFRKFAENVDEWASITPATLGYYGGRSLISQSHGQGHISYFGNRYKIKGLYFLDEPENALSPRKQLELLRIISEMSNAGHAQFIIASHSPIILACPNAEILSFDHYPIKKIKYEDTDYFKLYTDFMNDRGKYINS